MPIHSRPYENGNLYVRFNLTFPLTLGAEQKQVLLKCLPGHAQPPVVPPNATEVSFYFCFVLFFLVLFLLFFFDFCFLFCFCFSFFVSLGFLNVLFFSQTTAFFSSFSNFFFVVSVTRKNNRR